MRIAHEKNADLFISIHANAARASSAQGIEVFVSPDGDRRDTIQRLKQWNQTPPPSARETLSAPEEYRVHRRRSLRLARNVEQRMEEVAPTGSRGVKKKSLHVLRNAPCPAVLVETGFMTNKHDARLLSRPDYRRKMGRAIANAVIQFHRLYVQN